MLAAGLSASIEWLQSYSPSRVSSLLDLISNASGAFIGASLSWAGRWIIPSMLGAMMFEFRRRPAATLLKAYVAGLIVFAMMPFSIAMDRGRLAQALQSSNFVPFSMSPADLKLAEAATLHADDGSMSLLRWRQLKRWSRWTAEAVSFTILASMLQHVLRIVYGFCPRSALALTAYSCGGLAIVLSLLQVPIENRGCDTTDVLFRILGAAAGVLAWSMFGYGSDASSPRESRISPGNIARAGAALAAAFILYNGMLPFEFARPADVGERFSSQAMWPFFAYAVSRFDVMMSDVFEKVASFAVFAAFLATVFAAAGPLASARSKSYSFRILSAVMTLSMGMEFVQVFLPIRVPSLTDPLLAVAGGTIGILVHAKASELFAFARAHEMLGPTTAVDATSSVESRSLADRLLAALMEPDSDAPRETLRESLQRMEPPHRRSPR